MSLTAGSRIGPYEVLGLLGAGGMGEVYRARDAKLQRDVAIKVLPPAFANDPERLARFEREAQVLASLNHPNIAAIYGFEDKALVLELVDGPTLADRIAQGPIPLEDALPIARQIADALEAAHEHGVIHRDLKPANIKLRADGTVKVLDFGLAKLSDPTASNAPNDPNGRHALSLSPTLMSPAVTQMGFILGTAAYMSPEQAKGKAVDRRADMWAFGCVLFEMLTGIRPFGGDDVTDTIAYVITREPDWKALPPETPPALVRLMRRCLVKDPKQRLADAASARIEIDEARREPAAITREPVPQRGGIRWWWTAGLAALALVVGVVGMGTVIGLGPSAPPKTVRFTLEFPPNVGLYGNAAQRIAITPDGRRIVYSGLAGNVTRIYVRDIDSIESAPIAGVDRVGSLFLSPDGQWIGFNDTGNGSFRKVPIGGGPPATITEIPAASGGFAGVTWGSRGVIVFATSATPGLMRVPDAGGIPEPLTAPAKGVAHRFPHFLPDGDGLLLAVQQNGQPDRVAVLSLDAQEPRVLLDGTQPRYASSGHLLFLRENAVWAVRFDARTRTVTGDAAPVLERVELLSGTTPLYHLAADGTLVYVPAGSASAARRLVWTARDGREELLDAPARPYGFARVSPDGSAVAVSIEDQEEDVWIFDLARKTLRRLTLDRALERMPIWSPDGRTIAFSSLRDRVVSMYAQPADGTGAARRLVDHSTAQVAGAYTPDGKWLLFSETAPEKTLLDIMRLELATGRVEPAVQTEFAETNPAIAPDGRWLAYESRQGGRGVVMLRPYPNVNQGVWQVSGEEGGGQAVWGPDGRELFYVSGTGAVMRVAVDTARGLALGTPQQIFAPKYFFGGATNPRTYDIAPDGRRFLMIKPLDDGTGPTAPAAIVVVNWTEELKRRVPVK